MREIKIYLYKNGSNWEDGTPFIKDDLGNIYQLTPISKHYYGDDKDRVVKLATVFPRAIQAEREDIEGIKEDG
jgi:hypothetical protein